MSHDNEVLWVVEKRRSGAYDISPVKQRLLFRTRAAATKYKKDKEVNKTSAYQYFVVRATWGPEQ